MATPGIYNSGFKTFRIFQNQPSMLSNVLMVQHLNLIKLTAIGFTCLDDKVELKMAVDGREYSNRRIEWGRYAPPHEIWVASTIMFEYQHFFNSLELDMSLVRTTPLAQIIILD